MTDNDALLVPAEVGEKVTVTSWFWPALTLKEVGETENAAASAPERVMSGTTSVASPELDMLSVWEPDAPTVTDPKAREDETEIDGAVPVPLNDTLVGLPVAL